MTPCAVREVLPHFETGGVDRYMAESDPGRPARGAAARRFVRLAWAFVSGDGRRRARGWLAALLVLSIAVGGVQVLISYAARDFVTALSERDAPAFYRNLWRYLGVFALAIPVGVF